MIAYGTKRAANTGVGHESHAVLQKDKPTILPVQPDSLPPSPPQKRQKISSPSGALLLNPVSFSHQCCIRFSIEALSAFEQTSYPRLSRSE